MMAYSIFPHFGRNSRAAEILSPVAGLSLSTDDARPGPEELARLLGKYNVLIAGVLERFPEDVVKKGLEVGPETGPRLIVIMARGLDKVDLAYCRKRKVSVINAGHAHARGTAEHAFALVMACMKRLGEADQALRDGKGWEWRKARHASDLKGKVLGVVGAGRIAQHVMRFGAAFGMKVLCHTRRPKKYEALKHDPGVRFTNLNTLCKRADAVSVHLPLAPGTENLIDRKRLALLKPQAILVNTSRGEVLDEEALADALQTGDLACAALDAFDGEPDVNPKLLNAPRERLILTPHSACQTTDSLRLTEEDVARRIVRWARRIKSR